MIVGIDISSHGSVPSFRELEWFSDADIPVGDVLLAEIPFQVRDAIVLMHGYVEDGKSGFYPALPQEVTIEVGGRAKYLAFLHTALFQQNAFRWENDEAIAGEYRIRFEDGMVERLPVTLGGNIRNCGSSPWPDLECERPAVVADRQTILSACCWENLYPDKAIQGIDVVSIEDTATSIALFAITALAEKPWDSGVFRSAADIQAAARRGRIAGWRRQAREEIEFILVEKAGSVHLDDVPVNTSILKVEDDQEFLRAIDLERPELSRVREAQERGDLRGAMTELARHWRGRRKWFEEVLQTGQMQADEDTGKADELCRDWFTVAGWTCDYAGKGIDFYAVPKDMEPEPHWYFTHGLQYVGPVLADAYVCTGDEKYARRMFRHFEEIIRDCPIEDGDGVGDNEYALPAADVDGDGWPDRAGQAQAWETCTVGGRLVIWLRCLTRCMEAKCLTDELLLTLCRSVLEQARHLFTQQPAHMPKHGNHATHLANVLIECGTCFPEFRCAEKWRGAGQELTEKMYGPFWENGEVYPDGSTCESHTGAYGVGMVRDLKSPMRLLSLSGTPMPQALHMTLEKMYEWLLYITTPLGYAASISMVHHDHFGFNVEEIGREASDATGREDFLSIGTGGREGTRPKHTSYPFTSRMPCYGGVYAMRSGWEREALYLCAKMGPMHYRHCANQGHFTLDAYGTEFLIGPGYAHEDGEFHEYTDKYMCGDGMSYNTISVDGTGQKQGNRTRYARRQLDNTWLTNPLFDFLQGNYDFTSQGIDVLHTRSILFVKSEYWLVMDRLTGADGTIEHGFRMKYQLDKDLEATCEGNDVDARHPSTGASLKIRQLSEGFDLRIARGEKTPRIEGWLAVAENAWPAPAAIYERRCSAPAHFETLFYPLPGGEEAVINTRRDGAKLTVQVERGGKAVRDVFLLSSHSCEELSFEGELAWLRFDEQGLQSVAMIGGRELRIEEAGLDVALVRAGVLCLTREESGKVRIFSDLSNDPALQIDVNQREVQLDPGEWCLS